MYRARIGDLAAKPSFWDECRDVLGPYYEDPAVPLAYAVEREATHVYTWSVGGSKLDAVFFARMPEALHTNLPLVAYMGLTVVRDRNGKSLARLLWKKFLLDVRRRAGIHPVLAWYRTASPFGLHPAHAMLEEGAPSRDGHLTEPAADRVRLIREAVGLPPAGELDHPCVVRGYARSRYGAAERRFIDTYREAHGADILQRLGVDEHAGDRLLLTGWVP